MNPTCKNAGCGARLLRWAWYEGPDEPFQWWYCLECDLAERLPFIQVLPTGRVQLWTEPF